MQAAINTPMPRQTPQGLKSKADSRRHPIYPGSENISHAGLRKIRRTVTWEYLEGFEFGALQ
jgi:hypothetical protein